MDLIGARELFNSCPNTRINRCHYVTIQKRVEAATEFGHVLYLVSNHDLLLFLVREFCECNRAVYFGLRSDFLCEALSLPVRSNCSPLSITFRSLLTGGSLALKSSRSKPAQAPLFTH